MYLERSKLGSHQFLDVLGEGASSRALYDVSVATDVIVRRYDTAGTTASGAAVAVCPSKLWIDERRGCDVGSGGW